MTDAQRKMAEENLPLVAWYMKRTALYIAPGDYDDAFQQGALGLCLAAMNCDPEAETAFSTYAMYYIAGHIRKWAKCKGRYDAACPVRLEEEAPGMDGGATLQDRIADERLEIDPTKRIILREAMDRLCPTERRMLELAVRGYTQMEITRRCRALQPAVSRQLGHARKKIKVNL